ncbi:MAG: DUF819 family protein [Planctomycetota bacterium]|nr:DUF819 family protein [Planctomycetota bacterium]
MAVDHPLYILGVLGLLLALCEWLVRVSFVRHLGSALAIILVTALVVNLGVLPAAGQLGSPAVYDALLGPVAQLAIFWLLLEVSLIELRKAGGAMVGAFLLGSVGTLVGVVVAMRLVVDLEVLGEHVAGVGAMFVGTYTGGSINFQAMATQYGVKDEGGLFLASVTVDNLMTTVWMAMTLLIPRLLGRREPGRVAPITGEAEDTEAVHPMDLGILLALGGLGVWGSGQLATWLSGRTGASVPSVLVLTTLALLAAQVPAVRALRGRRVMGMTAVYLFLAAIGALCDVSVLPEAGRAAGTITLMVVVALTIHGVIVYGGGRLLRLPTEVISVASQANVGGGTSALALARSLGRADLVLPAILVGALGNALGNYLGVLAAHLLG